METSTDKCCERVKDYDIFRYLVRSYNDEKEYLVDISENEWRGQCDCPHWTARLGKKVRSGERLRCKHIAAARDYALDGLGRRLETELNKIADKDRF